MQCLYHYFQLMYHIVLLQLQLNLLMHQTKVEELQQQIQVSMAATIHYLIG